MKKLSCPNCREQLLPKWLAKRTEPYYADCGEWIYCSECDFTADVIIFQGSTYVEEKQDKLRAQVEGDKFDPDVLEWT